MVVRPGKNEISPRRRGLLCSLLCALFERIRESEMVVARPPLTQTSRKASLTIRGMVFGLLRTQLDHQSHLFARDSAGNDTRDRGVHPWRRQYKTFVRLSFRPSVCSFVGQFTRNKTKIPEWESMRGVRLFVRHFFRPLVRSSDGLQETNKKSQNGKPLWRSRRQSPANAATTTKRAVPPSSSCQRMTRVHITLT